MPRADARGARRAATALMTLANDTGMTMQCQLSLRTGARHGSGQCERSDGKRYRMAY